MGRIEDCLRRLHIKMGWLIIESKILYYKGLGQSMFSDKAYDYLALTDSEYDNLERRYNRISKLYNIEPYATDMVGVDMTRPSVGLAMGRLKNIAKGIRKNRFTKCKLRIKLIPRHSEEK